MQLGKNLRRFPLALALSLGTSAGAAESADPVGPGPEVLAEARVDDRSVKVLAAEPVITMPRELDAASFQEEHRFDDRRLGTSYRYLDGMGITIDVFVYPLADPKLVQSDAAALDWIEDDFLESMKQARKAGTFKKFKVLDRAKVMLVEGDDHGSAVALLTGRRPPGNMRHITLRVDTEDDRMRSEMICFSRDGLAIKIRRTQPEASMREGMALGFARSLHATEFIAMPQPPSADIEYANPHLGLQGIIGAAIRGQIRLKKADAAATPAAPAPPTAAPSPTPPR
jgi:hypothetical protein